MDTEKIYNNAKSYGVPVIRNESHKILMDIVSHEKPKHILEIGTAVGYSGIAMLSVSDADLLTIEHNKNYAKVAKQNFKQSGDSCRAKILIGDCMIEIAKMVASKKYDDYFDFIFLDGPKAQYDLMLENLLFLLSPNGTLVADNVLFHGYVDGTLQMPTKRYKTIAKRLNQFIENCKNNPKLFDFKLINTEDGIIFAKKVKNEN
jgi:predicted O-methyltransferase YrrM